jgi:ZIP family zinc transporter
MDGMYAGLLLATLAGLSTLIGAVLGIIFKNPGPKFLTLTFAFSAGIMIYMAFSELLPEAVTSIGYPLAHIWFLIGMVVMYLIDVSIPHDYGPETWGNDSKEKWALTRTGFLIALGIAIHNLPEGIAVFAGSMQNTNIGIALAIAIGLHNIPEGFSVATPIVAGTGNRRLAFMWSFVSGLAEPLGALLTMIFLNAFMSPALLGGLFAFVGGVMLFISLDELLPTATKFGYQHLSIIGVMLGIFIMGLSIWLLQIL